MKESWKILQLKLKKNTLERTENKLDDTKKQISKLEERVVEITEIEQKEEKN